MCVCLKFAVFTATVKFQPLQRIWIIEHLMHENSSLFKWNYIYIYKTTYHAFVIGCLEIVRTEDDNNSGFEYQEIANMFQIFADHCILI